MGICTDLFCVFEKGTFRKEKVYLHAVATKIIGYSKIGEM